LEKGEEEEGEREHSSPGDFLCPWEVEIWGLAHATIMDAITGTGEPRNATKGSAGESLSPAQASTADDSRDINTSTTTLLGTTALRLRIVSRGGNSTKEMRSRVSAYERDKEEKVEENEEEEVKVIE
jgi:hypothetical protein